MGENATRPSVAIAAGKIQPSVRLTTHERDSIIAILSNEKHGFGFRAGKLLRTHPRLNYHRTKNPDGFSLPARLLYLHLAQFVGVDKKRPKDQVAVSLEKLAGWLGVTERYASTIVSELTRRGPLPLLVQSPGQIGRVSVYTFVRNPFVVAQQQEAAAAVARRTRQPGVVKAQHAAFAAEGAGVIDAAERERRGRESHKRREWALPARGAVMVVADAATVADADSPVNIMLREKLEFARLADAARRG